MKDRLFVGIRAVRDGGKHDDLDVTLFYFSYVQSISLSWEDLGIGNGYILTCATNSRYPVTLDLFFLFYICL
jgi:hypothetical protein